MAITSYWQSHIDSRINTIKSKQGSGKFNFAYITDMHMTNNVGSSGELLDYLDSKVDIPYVLNGGDTVNNYDKTMKSEAVAQIDNMFKVMAPVKNKMLYAMANHDDNSITNKWDQTITDVEQYNRYFSYLSGRVTAGPSGKYYFADDVTNQVRYIVLDSIDIPYIRNSDGSVKYKGQWIYAFRQAQLTWLADVALNVPNPNWYVVVMSHVPPSGTGIVGYDYDTRNADMALGILKAFKERTSVNMSSKSNVESDFKASISKSFVGRGGNVVAWLSGHVHYDNLVTTTEGIKLITTTPDSLFTWADGPTKTRGTISEQAFDVFTIDKNTNTGYITRVGAGNSRQFTFTTTKPVTQTPAPLPPAPPTSDPETPSPPQNGYIVPIGQTSLIHILDKQTDDIIGTLNPSKGDVTSQVRVSSLTNLSTFDFTAFKHFDLLTKRNRILVPDIDGHFNEYIINYANQYKRSEKTVSTDASFIDLKKAKVIEPQTLVGTTPQLVAKLALEGTEWQVGEIDYPGIIRTVVIDKHMDPYTLLNNIASIFNLEIRFYVKVVGNRIVGRYVDLKEYVADFSGKEIVFAKDLINITRREDNSNIVTALLGIGPEKPDGTRITTFVEDMDALARWGRKGQHLVGVYEPFSDNGEMTLDELKTLTEIELQNRINGIVSYDCEAAAIEHIFGREHEKIRLGQTVRIKDDGYTPPLYLEARIQETTENPSLRRVLSFKIGNFIEYNKDDLEKQIANLKTTINNKIVKMVTLSVESSAGDVFKGGVGTTTLTAKVFLVGNETDLDGSRYTYTWSVKDKDGKVVEDVLSNNKSIQVTASNVTEKATYVVEITGNGVKMSADKTLTIVNDGTAGQQGPQGPPGEDSWRVEILSSNGNIFKSNNINTILYVRVYKGDDDVTDIIPIDRLRWTRVSKDPYSDDLWNQNHFAGRTSVVITSDDVQQRATFQCQLLDENFN